MLGVIIGVGSYGAKNFPNRCKITIIKCVLCVDGGGVSSGGEIVVLIEVFVGLVVAEVGYWWWHSGDGGAGDRLCNIGSCHSWRSSIVKLVVVMAVVVVVVEVMLVVFMVVVVVLVLWWWLW